LQLILIIAIEVGSTRVIKKQTNATTKQQLAKL